VIVVRALPFAAGLLCVTIALCTPCPAFAQGNGNGRPKSPKPAAPASSGSQAPATSAPPATTYPQFGTWLDDASAPSRGDGVLSIAAGHWRLAGMTQTNVPMLAAAIGVTDRLQLGASVPFYRVSTSTWSARGLDDIYLSGKYTLLDPTLTISEIGVAVSPVLEVLSADTAGDRVHFALPVSVELRRLPFRVYGTAGYFTRGSLFGGAAVEWIASNGTTFSGSVVQSYSVRTPTASLAGLGRQHADVSVGAAVPAGHIVSVFGNIGRSLTSVDAGGSSLAVTGGIALRFSAASATP
jgi:hypothetical protein